LPQSSFARRPHRQVVPFDKSRRSNDDQDLDQYVVLERCRRFGDLPVSARYTEITETTIKSLVDSFYVRVRRDPTLGPIFTNAIAEEAWPAHLEKMYAFWSSVMLTSGRYKGNPVATHRTVAGLAPPLFSVWLDSFEATAKDLFVPEAAGRFVIAARRIAESLKLALFFRPDRAWPEDLPNRPSVTSPCS
jgi:hemoglobin